VVAPAYSQTTDQQIPMNVYWGDTHVHTNLSMDAHHLKNKIKGGAVLGLEQAYRFAKGHPVTAPNGMTATLQRPLDFLVLADHASNLGLVQSLENADPALLNTPDGKLLFDQWQAGRSDPKYNNEFIRSLFAGPGVEKSITPKPVFESAWQRVGAAADKHNEPGAFTAFIGYEWTSFGKRTEVRNNLHRVVIFKDNADKTNRVLPFTAFDSVDPVDLWQYFEDYERTTDGEVLGIPHNGNFSRGGMFSSMDRSGQAFSKAYAQQRSRWEPLYEITQMKGDSETFPSLSPLDEFADFERMEFTGNGPSEKQYEYVRSALKLGLGQQSQTEVNPFKFGVIGSTDVHTGLASAEEDNNWGKNPGPERPVSSWSRTKASGGYAAVWATENTRESLFAAMKRKEVYATTGPRMTVRFFGGWDYDKDDAFRHDLARIGYAGGVPMGGDLTAAPTNKPPQFLIRAVKDAEGANLDRVQVIKGWRSKDGELHEKIYNVALSDNRKPNWRGKVKPVGTTVDVAEASYTNRIGDPELATVWEDPDFDKNELAFYYVRVLEIPTPRWTAYDAKTYGVKDVPEDVPMVIQERAYTSPIWFTP